MNDGLNFKNPKKNRRGIIFWAWNNDLPEETLSAQIEVFDRMGLGGFYMHSRSGMSVKYMGEEFLEKARFCIDEAKKRGMYACLYDEDGFPSGYAGGYVSRRAEYAEKYLRLECVGDDCGDEENCRFYDIELDGEGYMKSYRPLLAGEEAKYLKWRAEVASTPPTDQFNQNPYADLLNPDAVDCFIKETHEKYYEKFGADFGKTVERIFTDEPRWRRISEVKRAEPGFSGALPWTSGLAEKFSAEYGADFWERLPELFLDRKGEYSRTRYRYYRLISELFEESFIKRYAAWCSEHGIEFTGHLDCEENLSSQLSVCGEHMPKYMHFDVPGIDVLHDARQYTTAKQAQSAAHQTGKRRIMSEYYGVTGWELDFSEHKLGGDWQAALGVTDRVPHLAWVSMKKNGKRDCPASIGEQAPWCGEYKIIEDHFARLSEVLVRGKPQVKIGVIHPIESMWMTFGARQTQWGKICAMNEEFEGLAKTLLLNQMDYDYISEATIPALGHNKGVGEMSYECILVPECVTLRRTTLDFLQRFRAHGGRVIFAGMCPDYVDGALCGDAREVFCECEHVKNNVGEILSALEQYRDVEVINSYGDRDLRYIYQYRTDSDSAWLFAAKGTKEEDKSRIGGEQIEIIVKGEHIPELWDTLTGEVRRAEFTQENGCTRIYFDAHVHDSFLIRLEEGQGEYKREEPDDKYTEIRLNDVAAYSLQEPNVAILDFAEWAADGGEYAPSEYIRKIEKAVHEYLNVPPIIAGNIQPWAKPEYGEEHVIRLRYTFESDIEGASVRLAAEDAERLKIRFNGKPINTPISGHYVDRDIRVRALGSTVRGTNVLEAEFKLNKNSSFEAMYLLGGFGVQPEGRSFRLTEKPKRLFWGDTTLQKLPFYSGIIDYTAEFETEREARARISVPDFSGSCVRVYIDERDCGLVAFSPYEADLGNIPEGKHKIRLRLFGNRENTFANPHNVGKTGKDGYRWRDFGDSFCNTQKTKPFGILSEPRLKITV